MKLKRLASILLTMTLALSLMSALAIDASASIKPNYSAYRFSEVYKSSPYYDALKSVKLTGDHRYDVVAVALSQVGYHEGSSDADMDGLNLTSSGNFVEYNRLFCTLYNSSTGKSDYGYAWCAAFASWCQYMAGVPSDIDCSEVSCPRMIKEILTPQGLYREASSGYVPLTGDLIYFKNSTSSVSTHVGIVVGVKDGYVYTVEGNANDRVCQKKYALTDSYVMGYGALKYKTLPTSNYSDFPLVDSDILAAGSYKITASSLNVRAGASTSFAILGTLSRGDEVEVLEFDGSWGRIDYKGTEGWISTSYITPCVASVYTVSYNAVGGAMAVSQQRKLKGASLTLTKEIPIRDGSVFLGWSLTKNGEVAYAPGATYSADADATLYAVWEKERYTVTFLDWDGTLIESLELEYGEQITPPAPPKRESDGTLAYEFDGWDKKPIFAIEDTTFVATYSSRELTDEEKAALTEALADAPTKTPHGCSASLSALTALPLIALLCPACAGLLKRKSKIKS